MEWGCAFKIHSYSCPRLSCRKCKAFFYIDKKKQKRKPGRKWATDMTESSVEEAAHVADAHVPRCLISVVGERRQNSTGEATPHPPKQLI